jgi:DNA invertase Pin-like site-specific DNA recombinase
MPPQRAAIYCRISQDRGGEKLGVERQEALCRDLADRKSWPVVEVYTDNDVSAYAGAVRPQYDAMLEAIRAGQVDAVLCVDLDRLTRQPAELESFITLADDKRVALANVSGEVDLSTSDGRFRARIMGAVARQESERKSERLKRQRDQRAREGKPHPTVRRFGWNDDMSKLDRSEAALIRRAVRDLLAGMSYRAVGTTAW